MPRGKLLAWIAVVGAAAVLGLPQQSEAMWPFKKKAKKAPIYAAADYGAPVTVPMSQRGRDTYEYSWGVPSSSVPRVKRRFREKEWPDCDRCPDCGSPLKAVAGLLTGPFVCAHCKRQYVLTPTPSPVTSTRQLGYYYARVPR